MDELQLRAARHAALGDTVRLAIVDELSRSDRAPIELRQLIGIESNLLAHHLDVLEQVGLIIRTRSSGDGRRRYVHLLRDEMSTVKLPAKRIRTASVRALPENSPPGHLPIGRALFVCTHNSARSQLAAAIWRSVVGTPAQSAGTHPAEKVHPGAVAAAKRIGLDLTTAVPRSLDSIRKLPPIVVTVCDQAHEELPSNVTWLHWSLPDPVADGSATAFDAVVTELRSRINAFTPSPS
jgi:ArsR family transcriptional regulator, arsenate/arsenite/antimonite-responsive transcriptional repressor / arsenate reductase (thioredoxin)